MTMVLTSQRVIIASHGELSSARKCSIYSRQLCPYLVLHDTASSVLTPAPSDASTLSTVTNESNWPTSTTAE